MSEQKVYSYRYVPWGPDVDLDEARRRAVRECYLAALNDGLHPVTRPEVRLVQPDVSETALVRTYVEVTVMCVP